MEKAKSKMRAGEAKEALETCTTFFANQKHRMKYASYEEQNLPIGSGVTEAACKVLVKQRLCASGMRWKETGAAAVLSLRALTYTSGRWDEFWGKINHTGWQLVA